LSQGGNRSQVFDVAPVGRSEEMFMHAKH
jgi:hypothetical protein